MIYDYANQEFQCNTCKEIVSSSDTYCHSCGRDIRIKLYPVLDLQKTELFDRKGRLVYTHDIIKASYLSRTEELIKISQNVKIKYMYLEVILKEDNIFGKIIFINQIGNAMRCSGYVDELIDISDINFTVIGNIKYNPMCWKEDLNK